MYICEAYFLPSVFMSIKDQQQNVWFGVSMFLGGMIVGVILVGASGISPFGSLKQAPQGGVEAPTAPNAPEAPQGNIQETILGFALDMGLDEDEFKACVADNKYEQLFNDQMAAAQKAGVNGTPGNILIDMKTGNARVLSGAQPFEAFKKNIDEMLKDPKAKSTDPGTPQATDVDPVDFEKDHVRGSTKARLALIEYSDYECPFCRRVHPTYEQIMQEYDGKIVWVYRHFPLSFHQNAIPLATGAECAGELEGPDAFWEFTDKAMSMQ